MGKLKGYWIFIYYAYLGAELTPKNLTSINRKLCAMHNWYHSFDKLGLKTNIIKTGNYVEGQEDKAEYIFKFTNEAIDYIKVGKSNVRGCELFCADGFYSIQALNYGATYMYGIDLAEESGEGGKRASVLEQARLVADVLGYKDNVKYEKKNVFDLCGTYDFCICAGGLYHIDNPQLLLKNLKQHTKYLIIQTVVTLETEDSEYFVSPAPGWTWGCRFTHAWLLICLEELGWKILGSARNELRGNSRLCDRGSSYVLCVNDE